MGVKLQLMAAVLHWDDAGSRHGQPVAQLLYLREEEEEEEASRWFLKKGHRSGSVCWNSSNLGDKKGSDHFLDALHLPNVLGN